VVVVEYLTEWVRTSRLAAGVFSPDMQDKHSGDEYERANQYWQRSHFDARRIVSVEPPHASCRG